MLDLVSFTHHPRNILLVINLFILGLVSKMLGLAFDVEIDLSKGIGAAPSTFKIVKTIGAVTDKTIENILKMVESVHPGPEYVKGVAMKLELYISEREKKLSKK